MSNIVSDRNSFEVVGDICTPFVEIVLIGQNKVKYDKLLSPNIEDILMNKVPEVISNKKYYRYTEHSFDIKDGYLHCDTPIQYGHMVSEGSIYGIMYNGEESHIIDLINASFMFLATDPSISTALLQTVFLLSRIYLEDTPPATKNKMKEGVKPYEL